MDELKTVTLPLIRPGLANAFLLGFIESMADFGNPLVLGGNLDVLSTEIFFAIVGAQYDQSGAAILATILLGFTLLAFYFQRFWLGKRLRHRNRQGRLGYSYAAVWSWHRSQLILPFLYGQSSRLLFTE